MNGLYIFAYPVISHLARKYQTFIDVKFFWHLSSTIDIHKQVHTHTHTHVLLDLLQRFDNVEKRETLAEKDELPSNNEMMRSNIKMIAFKVDMVLKRSFFLRKNDDMRCFFYYFSEPVIS